MIARALFCACALLGLWSCERPAATAAGPRERQQPSPRPPRHEDPPSAAADPERGRMLVAAFECNRCHDGTGGAQAPREKHCVRCHQEIMAGSAPFPARVQARWRGRMHALLAVPSLTGIGQRLRRDFVERFLLEPYDLRPALEASMPRLPLDAAQARDIAAFLVPQSDAPAGASDPGASAVAAGRALFEAKACAGCHAFSGADAPRGAASAAEVAPDTRLLAPDLRHTRDRFTAERLGAWLLTPRALKPDSAMPDLGLGRDEAEALAAYLLHAPLATVPARTVPERLPPLARPVGFAELEREVFRKVCWHCHSDPSYALGDGGPGNSGGFGFAPRGLSLASYAEVMSGALDDQGGRTSIFAPGARGMPRLLEVLVARQHEEAGRPLPGVRGMPLGLPALDPAQIQLVESWIAQGRPQ